MAIGPKVLTSVTCTFLAATHITVAAQDQSAAASLVDEATIFRDTQSANGGGYNKICIGNLETVSTSRRGLLRYQLPAIPEGATVTRVTLSMLQEKVRFMGAGAPKAATLNIKKAMETWAEGSGGSNREACGGGTAGAGVTWGTRPATAETASGSAGLLSSNNLQVTLDTDIGDENDGLIADVQAWVDGAANEGWELSVAEESDANNARLIQPGQLTVYWTEDQAPEFIINPGLNDVWFNPDTAGLGFSFTVFQDIGLFFLTWYTFDTERPLEGVEALLGEPGHRWLTALGTWEGNVVTLELERTRGGVFMSPEPAIEQDSEYGVFTIEFHDCESATLSWDIPSLGLMGSTDVGRALPDNVAMCEVMSLPEE